MVESGLGALLPEMRLDFWDSLWNGEITSAHALERRLRVLGLPLGADAPCCRCVLRLAHGDAYLDHIWRYGRDRLRVAVGNLLPSEDRGVVYGVCRLTPRHVYILACATPGMDMAALQARAAEDINALTRALEQYLDLQSDLKEILPVPSIVQMGGEAKA
ncbi:MAG: hypothetical protein LBN04_01630 [Oscillospiraceae bacterium]|jgi:hypothetical protein|nr:hypothetical protein [Oscillospiraceae bacterium]